VNLASKSVLLPINGIAFRTFAIHEDSWYDAIADCLNACKFQTFPQFIEAKQLPKEITDDMPLIQDGLEYWFIVRKFVENYISIWYFDDGSINNDVELKNYWLYYHPSENWIDYGIPTVLNKENLINQITHSIFHVTAGHELVGSVVEYLKNPAGLGSKIVAEKNQSDVQSHLQSLTLAALTGNEFIHKCYYYH
jgi:hypothetical protein